MGTRRYAATRVLDPLSNGPDGRRDCPCEGRGAPQHSTDSPQASKEIDEIQNPAGKGKKASMSEYIVTGVRKALSADGTHRHISEVCTQGAIYFTRQEVIDCIWAGHTFRTLVDGHSVEVHIIESCIHTGCLLGPYIATDPDSTDKDNLENLEPC